MPDKKKTSYNFVPQGPSKRYVEEKLQVNLIRGAFTMLNRCNHEGCLMKIDSSDLIDLRRVVEKLEKKLGIRRA